MDSGLAASPRPGMTLEERPLWRSRISGAPPSTRLRAFSTRYGAAPHPGHGCDALRRAEKPADGLDELGHRDRLRQMGLTAALADAFFIALHRKCGDRDHRNGLELGVLLEPFRHFETGYFRQLYIHQDQIWPVLAGEIERLDAVACGDGVIAVRFQQVVEELHVELVVLHDHHGFRHRRCSDLRCPMRCRLPPRDWQCLANRHFHARPTLLPCKREREQPEPLARTDSAGPRPAVVPRRYGNPTTE